jgi:hypothetical protein
LVEWRQVAVSKHSESAKDLKAQIARLELKVDRYRLKSKPQLSVHCVVFVLFLHFPSGFGETSQLQVLDEDDPQLMNGATSRSQTPRTKDARPSSSCGSSISIGGVGTKDARLTDAKRPSGEEVAVVDQPVMEPPQSAPSIPKPKPKLEPKVGKSDIQDDIAKLLELNKADKKRRGRAADPITRRSKAK